MEGSRDRLEFMVDLANNNNLENPQAFTEADLAVLRQDLGEFTGHTVGIGEKYVLTPDFLGFAAKPDRRPRRLGKSDFLQLRDNVRKLFDQFAELREGWSGPAGLQIDTWGQLKVTLRFSAGMFVTGATLDVVLFLVIVLVMGSNLEVLRCPNWESRVCKRTYFIKEGKQRFCSLRCGNAYRVRQARAGKLQKKKSSKRG